MCSGPVGGDYTWSLCSKGSAAGVGEHSCRVSFFSDACFPAGAVSGLHETKMVPCKCVSVSGQLCGSVLTLCACMFAPAFAARMQI